MQSRRQLFKTALTTTGLALLLTISSANTESTPTVSLRIMDQQSPTPTSFEEDLLQALRSELRTYGCGVQVANAEDTPQFIVEIEVRHFEEFTQYDASMLSRATDFDPNAKNRLTAKIEFRGVARVLNTGETETELLSRKYNFAHAKRPMNLGYDETWARAEARRLAVQSSIDHWRKALCKAKKKADKSR